MKSLTVYQTSNEYVPTFLNQEIFNYWKVLNYSPLAWVSANNFTSRNAILLIFLNVWNAIDSLTCVPNFLFKDVYETLSFFFKIGFSLGLSCLMSSMFIIILIIRIIKTTFFGKTILMTELKGKLFESCWSLNFPVFFHWKEI